MRFSAFTFTALAAASFSLPSVLASTFTSNIDSTASHMSSLHSSLSTLESEARAAGHTEVATHCANARASLSSASSSWSELGSSASIIANPSSAWGSGYASSVWSGLSSCGDHINEIGSLQSGGGWSEGMTSAYGDCNSHYSGCQSGVTTVCGPPGGGYTTPTYGSPTTTTQQYGPSQTANGGYGGHGHGHGGWGGYRRNAKRGLLSSVSCPGAETACKLSSYSGSSFECVDTERELTSCGGCVSEGKGEDCTVIEGAAGVGCSAGSCVVFSCSSGYALDKDTGRCAPTFLRQGQSYH